MYPINPCLSPPCGLFSSHFLANTLHSFLICLHECYKTHLISLHFSSLTYTRVQPNKASYYAISSHLLLLPFSCIHTMLFSSAPSSQSLCFSGAVIYKVWDIHPDETSWFRRHEMKDIQKHSFHFSHIERHL
jgi:hypothetical protein